MAHYGYEDGWTLVTRQRKRFNYAGGRPMQQPNRNTTYHTRDRGTFSYADAVKFGKQTWPTFTKPQQGFYRPLTNTSQHQIRPNNPSHKRPQATVIYPRSNVSRQNKGVNPQRSDDPTFVQKTRALLKIIKLVHHKNNVAQDLPPAIRRLEQNITEAIKPALPNEGTQTLIYGNAKNWAYTTLLILRDHYEEALKIELAALAQFSPQELEKCFNTATQWAKRGIGRRLLDKTLHEAFTLAQEHWPVPMSKKNTQTVQRQTQSTSKTLTPARSVGQQVIITQAQVHAEAEVQSQPPVVIPEELKSSKTVCTMTEQGMDWPCKEPSKRLDFSEITESPRNLPPSLHITPATALPPRGEQAPHITPTIRGSDSGETKVSVELVGEEEGHTDSLSTHEHKAPESSVGAFLTSAIQTRLTSEFCAGTPRRSELECQEGHPTRHMSTNRKMTDWRLSVRKKWLLIGDSNLSKIQRFTHDNLQVDSFPGATFRHIEAVLKKTPESFEVEHVVLSLGINSRGQNAKDTAVKQMQRALREARQKFPIAQIWVPVVNYSGFLPLKEQQQLNTLNTHIQANMK